MDVFDTYYYDQDHLGNIRQVTDKSGKAVQTTDYYPFGMQLCDGTTNSFDQKHKYNGQGSCQRVQTSSLSMPSAAEAQPKVKEFDTMHGLNTYDYGARQYNPVTARWDRMDPLCEKYYSVSPYAYCENNPICNVDPDGRKSHNYNSVMKDGHRNEWKEGVRNNCAFWRNNNDPNVVNIWAHGAVVDKYSPARALEVSYRENSRALYITPENVSSLTNRLNIDDKGWNAKKTPIVVLHSCKAADLAQDLSATKEFKDVYIIAPTTTVRESKSGERLNSLYNTKTKKTVSGQWIVFKNGKVVLGKDGKPITYSSTAQPGTIGFNYRFKKTRVN